MVIEKTSKFKSVAQRCVWGYRFTFADFAPIISDMASEDEQAAAHEWMGLLLERLYEKPDLLDLPPDIDEAYEWYVCNNQKPELNSVYTRVFKILFEFYRFLYMAAAYGKIENNFLTVKTEDLKNAKAAFKLPYQKALSETGVSVVKSKTEITFGFKNEKNVCRAIKMLAVTKSLFDFVRCSYDGKFDYLLLRLDNACRYNGMLLDLEKECLNRGYQKGLHLNFGVTGFGLRYDLKTSVGGFILEFNPRKRIQFAFGTMNGIGVKAMIMDFDNLPFRVQKLLLDVCKRCNHCHGCTNGGKIKGGKDQNGDVVFQGENITLCSLFPWFWQERYDDERIKSLFEYHDMQIKYQPNK